jgi:hypothetical protein
MWFRQPYSQPQLLLPVTFPMPEDLIAPLLIHMRMTLAVLPAVVAVRTTMKRLTFQ